MLKLVKNSVDLAFKALGDLLISASLTKKSSPTFDFNTGIMLTEDDPAITSFRIALSDYNKKDDPVNILSKKVTARVSDIGDLSFYSILSVEGVDWTIGETIESNAFTSSFRIFRVI